MLTGGGRGQFTTNEANWVKIAENGAMINPIDGFSYAGNNLTLSGRIGAGTSEAYFKALRPEILPAVENQTIAGQSNLSAARGVGKLNVVVYGGQKYNLIGLPVIPGGNSVDETLSTALKQPNIEIMKFNNQSQAYQSMRYNGSEWEGDTTITVSTGEAVIVYNPSSSNIPITIIGSLLPTMQEYTQVIYGGGKYNLLSLPHVQGGNQANVDLTPLSGSEIMVLDNQTQQYSSARVVNNDWDSDVNVLPANSFWYYKTGDNSEWKTKIK
jgi:hypothetical protein